MRKFALVLGAVLLVAGTASAQEVQLDISSGFNIDAIVGPLEMQGIYHYNGVGDGRVRSSIGALQQITTGQSWRATWGVRGQYGSDSFTSNSSELGFGEPYTTTAQWWHPEYIDDTSAKRGFPEDGVLGGGDRDYHMASLLGNATLPGNWVSDPPVFADPNNPLSGEGMTAKFNVMATMSAHSSASFQIAVAEATLPVAQQGPYNNINFVLSAPQGSSSRARFMRINAVYSDGEEELYAFSDASGGSGPRPKDNDGGTEWDILIPAGVTDTVTAHGSTNGYQGVGVSDGSIYEFKTPFALDPARTLQGIKIYDSSPATNWVSRGLVIWAATAFAAGPGGDPDPAQSTVDATPNLIPDDQTVPSVVTVTLKDNSQNLLTGYENKLVVSVSGSGNSTVGTFSMVSDGVYEADFTNDTAGDKVVNVTVDMDPAGAGAEDIDLTDTAAVVVYTPGVSGPPLADAGPDQAVEDVDGGGDEDITLDGSGSIDGDGTIVSYSWSELGTEIATGVSPTVTLSLGAHLITLTVTDDDPNAYTDSDDLWVTVLAQGADPNVRNLDISSGFNMDAWCGPLEMQELVNYGHFTPPAQDLKQLQGDLAQNVNWVLLGNYSNDLLVANSSVEPYSTIWNWNHPQYVENDEGSPETGYIAGTSVDYYIASTGGNPLLPGDWTEVADPTAGEGGVACGVGMDVKFNSLVVGSAHSSAGWQIAEATATLPVAQQQAYAAINFVLAANGSAGANRALNMRIAAVYTDATEDVLWAFGNPDTTPNPREMDAANPDFTLIHSQTQKYNVTTGGSGAVGNGDEALYEFAAMIPLDNTKTLQGIRVWDSNPSLNWTPRGLTILAASALTEMGPVAGDPTITVATEDGLDWVYQNIPASVANGGHKVALTVTVTDLNGNNSVTVTVAKKAASGPGEVTILPGATDLEKLIVGSDRTAGTNGSLILEVTATGDIAGATTVEVPFACHIIGDVDGNGGAEPTDVSLEINKLNGLGNGGFHNKAFDLDANGGAEPGDVSILINVLNGVL